MSSCGFSALSTICCPEDVVPCFKEYCGDIKVDSTIAALGIVENDSLPKVGDTVQIGTGAATIITCDNYSGVLLDWLRMKQIECPGGGNFYHFFPTTMINKGMRDLPTKAFSETGSAYNPKQYLSFNTKSEFEIGEHYLPNLPAICSLEKRASRLSLVYFLKQGAMVVDADADGFAELITGTGFQIEGDRNKKIMGKLVFEESGKCENFFYHPKPNEYIKKLSKGTKFQFDAPTGLVGLTPLPCGKVGDCLAYTALVNAPIEIQPVVLGAVNCLSYDLFYGCDKDIPTGIVALVDEYSGKIKIAAGLPVGKHKFTVSTTNECCVTGSQCFTIEVK